ncbi:MAG TPA: nucleotidyltransferase family protein [Pyrinomonadaceae bacterium]
MLAVNNEAGCWPTPNQELLLRAALLQGEPALAAWNEWRRTVNIDVIDYGSHRMVPQVYRNMQRHGIKDPLMDRMKGVYRYYLYKNEILMHRIGSLLAAFETAGIQTMVLKGAALIPLYYKESGLRPMLDADVLVHEHQAEQAMDVLARLQWKSFRFGQPQTRIPIVHSTPFEDGGGRQMDLHWHLFWECFNASDDEDYWETAIPIQVGGTKTLALSATDQLLHTCWHGARWNEVPPIRWVADAMAILGASAAEIQWQNLAKKAKRHRIVLPVKDSLEYLKKKFDAPVPETVIKSLSAVRTSKMERENYELVLNPMTPPTTAKILRMLYYDYRWLSSSTNGRFKTLVFAKHLQAKWNIDHLWHVPFYMSMRMVRRVLTTRSA